MNAIMFMCVYATIAIRADSANLVQIVDETVIISNVAAKVEAIDAKIVEGTVAKNLGVKMQTALIEANESVLKRIAVEWGANTPELAKLLDQRLLIQAWREFYGNENVAKILRP